MNHGRTVQYQRNKLLETLLKEINELLGNAQKSVINQFRAPQHPVLLVVGGPRTGSTLMMQWLANLGVFAYPTNLLSRFYGAPYIGAKIQLMLTDPRYNFKDEILDFNSEVVFQSDLGKTRGALAPNDFWYFWRRFFPIQEPRYLEPEELQQADVNGFLRELAAIEAVLEKPLAMKGMLLEQNLIFLDRLFPKVVFLEITRNPLYNIQSLLESREKFFGNRHEWYSIKPREYHWLKDIPDPIEQVAGQVYYKNKILREQFAHIDSSRKIHVRYEDFCEYPEALFLAIKEKFQQQGYSINRDYQGPDKFQSANRIRLPMEEIQQIVAAYQKFSGEEVEP